MQSNIEPARALAVHFTDRPYFLSHLKSPRGRGSWAFQVCDSTLPMLWSPGASTYAEAKTWATSKVREMRAAGEIPADVAEVTLAAQP
jgi:hypothetical protein